MVAVLGFDDRDRRVTTNDRGAKRRMDGTVARCHQPEKRQQRGQHDFYPAHCRLDGTGGQTFNHERFFSNKKNREKDLLQNDAKIFIR